jgi:nucleotide-binding universal stress UspA family protein
VTRTDTAQFGKIVAGVDGSGSSIRALQWAARQANLSGSSLEVITTWEWPMNYGWAVPIPPEFDPRSTAQTLLDEAVADVRQAYPGLDVRTTIVEGHPAPVLIDASRTADLLVVGSRGHGEFAGMLLGSVSEHCVTNAHCPVVVMRGRP